MVDNYGRWFPDYPGQQPFMDPQFTRTYGQQPMQTSQQNASQQQASVAATKMTPPTIHAEIVQIEGGEIEAEKYPVGAGMSQMMIARDESAIFIKTATTNGYTLDVFEKRPPAPPPAPFNPDEYVRLSALPEIIAAEVQAALSVIQPAKLTRTKKETEASTE